MFRQADMRGDDKPKNLTNLTYNFISISSYSFYLGKYLNITFKWTTTTSFQNSYLIACMDIISYHSTVKICLNLKATFSYIRICRLLSFKGTSGKYGNLIGYDIM